MNKIIAIITFILLINSAYFPFSRASEIEVSTDDTKKIFHNAITKYNLYKNKDWETVGKMAIFSQLWAQNAEFQRNSDFYMERVNEEWDKPANNGLVWYDRTVRVADAVTKVLSGTAGTAGKAGAVVESVIGVIAPEGRSYLEGRASVVKQIQEYDAFLFARLNLSKFLDDVYDELNNTSGMDAWNESFAAKTGAMMGQSIDSMLKMNPDFQNNSTIQQLLPEILNIVGGISTTMGKTREQIAKEFESLFAVMMAAREDLVKLDLQQQDILAFMLDDAMRERARLDAEAKRQVYEQKLAAAQSSVYILSTVIGFADPRLGNDVGVIGNAAIQFADAVVKFREASGKNFLGLATAIFTGNVLSASLQIFSLFSGQTSPDQLILEEIAALRQQIDQLRQEMHNRFDRIDAKLNIIHTQLNEVLAKLDWQYADIRNNLSAIQLDLYTLNSQVSILVKSLDTFLRELFAQDLVGDLNFALGFHETHPGQYMYRYDYNKFENSFYTWAVNSSYATLSAGPLSQDRSYEDADLYKELIRYDAKVPYTNINYFFDFAKMRFGIEPIYERLSNPHDWAIGAEAYMQIARENPWYAAGISTSRLDDIIEAGKEIEAAMQSLSSADRPVIDQADWFYYDKVANLWAAIQAAEKAYFKAHAELTSIDIFGPTTQFAPIINEISFEGYPDPPPGVSPYVFPPVPSSPGVLVPFITLFDLYFPDHLTLWTCHNAFGLGNFSASINDVKITWDTRNTPAGITRFATMTVTLVLRYQSDDGNYHVVASSVASSDKVVVRIWDSNKGIVIFHQPLDYNGWRWVHQNWLTGNRLRSRFEQSVNTSYKHEETAWLLNAVDECESRLEEEFYSHQVALYQHTVKSITDQANHLVGAKRLLTDYASLGLTRFLQENDYLTALLFGNQSVLDGNDVLQVYQDVINELIKTQKRQMSKLDLTPYFFNGRRSEMTAQIDNAVGSIGDGIIAEIQPAVDMTLLKLQARKNATKALAGNDFYTVMRNTLLDVPVPFGVLANDTQQPGIALSAIVETYPVYGTLDLNDDGSFVYRPEAGYIGGDSFTYWATDGVTDSDPAQVWINVTCTDPHDADMDDDGIPDGNEDVNHNCIRDAGETSPFLLDSDGDGIQDGTEIGLTVPVITEHTDLNVFIPDTDPSTQTDPTNPDSDGDYLLDGEEDLNRNGKVDDDETDPMNPDTDGDTINDKDDVFPLDPNRWTHDITPMLELLLLSPVADLTGIGEDNVKFDPIKIYPSTTDRTGCIPESDFVGRFYFDARLENITIKTSLSELMVEIAELKSLKTGNRENRLVLPDESMGGIGAIFPIPKKDDYTHGILEPTEYVDVRFNICLGSWDRFEFYVILLGIME